MITGRAAGIGEATVDQNDEHAVTTAEKERP